MNSVQIKFGYGFNLGDDITDPDADQNFYDILKRNLFSHNFDLNKIDYGRHGEGGHIIINNELKTYKLFGYDSDKKFKKVSNIIDDSIDEYVDDFYNKQARRVE